jgi:two-component system, OmpR family, response regulator
VPKVEERVRGLDAGADDFVFKPFDFTELSARIRAVLQIEDLELDRMAHSVRRGSQEIALSPKEIALLELLMRNEGGRFRARRLSSKSGSSI